MMRRNVSDGESYRPRFWMVYEVSPGVWNSLAYWFVGAANRRAQELKDAGRLAFVEVQS